MYSIFLVKLFVNRYVNNIDSRHKTLERTAHSPPEKSLGSGKNRGIFWGKNRRVPYGRDGGT